jgi:hypothetical protein
VRTAIKAPTICPAAMLYLIGAQSVEIFARQDRQLALQIGSHRKLFLQDTLANSFGLRVADGFGSSDQGAVGRRFHVLERVTCHSPFDDFVLYEHSAYALA